MSREKENLGVCNMFLDASLGKAEEILKSIIDGDPKYIDPLTEIPKSQMTLYGFSGGLESAFFDTEEELTEYVKTNNNKFGYKCVIEYLGNVAGKSDVIRVTYKSGESFLYIPVDEDGYATYNKTRSIYRGEFVWEYIIGSKSSMYAAFRDRGIVFDNDIYARIEAGYAKIFEMFSKVTTDDN